MIKFESKEGKYKLKFVIVWIILILLVFSGLNTVVYAASGPGSNTDSNDEDDSIFNPFSLSSVIVTESEVNTNAVVSRPTIRITARPVLRSHFRPPLVMK